MIGEILVEKGYVTQQQLEGVLAVKGEGAQVGQVLIEWGLLTQEQLMEALEIQTPPPPPPRYVEPLPGESLFDFIQREKEFYEQNPDLRPPHFDPFIDPGPRT